MNARPTTKQYGIPNYFKKIGIGLIALVILSGVLVKIGVEVAQHTKDLLRVFALNLLIVGLLLIALAKDKVEDEMIIALKMKTMAFAFIWGVLIVIIHPIIGLISNDQITGIPGQELVLQMLVLYLIVYPLSKRKL
jgi:DMSO/TMAO reductase YedYZ heme-binding membrane subunit